MGSNVYKELQHKLLGSYVEYEIGSFIALMEGNEAEYRELQGKAEVIAGMMEECAEKAERSGYYEKY